MAEEINDEALADEWAAALAEAGEEGDPAAAEALADMAGAMAEPEADIQPAPFEDLQADPGAGIAEGDVNLDVIMDIPVTISMEVGSTHIPIRNLLQLNQGSVVELDRLAGEPLDVMVNGTLIAHGEVVVVNEKYGIRLTDVISPQERIKKLK